MIGHSLGRMEMRSAILVPGVPTKSRLESSINKLKPHLIYEWCCRPIITNKVALNISQSFGADGQFNQENSVWRVVF